VVEPSDCGGSGVNGLEEHALEMLGVSGETASHGLFFILEFDPEVAAGSGCGLR